MAEIEKEVDILSNLDHPNIIKLYSAIKTINNLYLFMEFCEFGDLKAFIQKRYSN